jgi:hypothetical protein
VDSHYVLRRSAGPNIMKTAVKQAILFLIPHPLDHEQRKSSDYHRPRSAYNQRVHNKRQYSESTPSDDS